MFLTLYNDLMEGQKVEMDVMRRETERISVTPMLLKEYEAEIPSYSTSQQFLLSTALFNYC